MIRYRQRATVCMIFTLVLFSMLFIIRGAWAQDAAADELPGSWQLTGGMLKGWGDAFAKMKVDVRDGVLTADYTGPFRYAVGPTGSVTGTITVSMRGNYAAKTGMSGTFKFSSRGTHDYGFNNIVKPHDVARECSFTNPARLEDGGQYAITLKCGSDSKPAVISFKVARADLGEGDGPTLAEKEEEPVDQLDPSRPSLEAIAGDIQWCDPQNKPGELMKIYLTIRSTLKGGIPEDELRVWEKPKTGKDLQVGDLIRTGTGAARITFKDGTKFLLRPGSMLEVTHFGFKIYEGGIHYEYQKYGKNIRLESRRSDFSVIGTAFSIETSADRDVLKVFKGKVEAKLLRDPSKSVMVEAGEEVTVTDDAISSKKQVDVEQENKAWNGLEKAASSAGGCSLGR